MSSRLVVSSAERCVHLTCERKPNFFTCIGFGSDALSTTSAPVACGAVGGAAVRAEVR